MPRRKLGMDLLAIRGDFIGAATRRHELEGADVLLELEEFFRQTDGIRLVVSSSAIFNRDVERHNQIQRSQSVREHGQCVKVRTEFYWHRRKNFNVLKLA